MKHLLQCLLALSFFSPLLTVANGTEDERWTGWCSYSELPGETFPASRMNLPGWACVKASRLKLHETYKVKTTLNPFYLSGDFNGDGRQDLAVWVEHIKSRKVGVLIIHGGKVAHTVIGAGVDWDKRGEDYAWMDMWSIEPKGKVFQSPHEGNRKVATRGDSLILTKSESAAFAVYWSGSRYRSYQLSD
jgi:hypothetical protein